MIKVGIIGSAGYTAGELIRILINHPDTEIVFANSSSNAGNPITSVHQGLEGETDLTFTDEYPFDSVDVLFLCSGHGQSKSFLENNVVPERVKIIDLSTDFRMAGDHGFIYGLPELNRKSIVKADKIANPGCFATAIQLAILPLAKNLMLNDDVHINAITGSTGAGQKPSSTTHFSWRNDNVSIYKAFSHQHLDEITQSVLKLQSSFSKEINFIPVRGNFSRGIFVSAYTKTKVSLDEIKMIYQEFYSDHGFTFISERMPDLKDVVNTNKCLVHLSKHGDKLLAVSVIDNLLKGASGQAVQNMNLIFGLEETTGLRLKATSF